MVVMVAHAVQTLISAAERKQETLHRGASTDQVATVAGEGHKDTITDGLILVCWYSFVITLAFVLTLFDSSK